MCSAWRQAWSLRPRWPRSLVRHQQRLRSIPILADIAEEVLEQLADLLMSMSLPAGRVVVNEGDPADTFYILVRGRVAVSHARDDEPEVVNVLEDGDYFGEVALLGSGVRSATITTMTSSLFLVLGRDAFQQLLEWSPQVHRELRERASQRWR